MNKALLSRADLTDGHMQNFEQYLRVQRSGRWNMFSPQAIAASGLDRDEYLLVMTNYNLMWEKFQELNPEATKWRSRS